MNEPVKPARLSRQRERSIATRARIREAALRLFIERGYQASTIESIAVEAGVAVQTVYFVFGNKRAVLAEIIDVAVAGDDAPIPVLDRPWVAELRAERDPRRAVRLLARETCRIVARQAPLYHVVHGAAAVDSEIAALLLVNKERRLATLTALVRSLADSGALAPGLGVERAADIVFAVNSHEMHQLLVVDRVWPAAAWEEWVTELLVAQVTPW